MENRAYSVLQVRSVDAEQRVIEGIATTPTVDRVGDVIDPLGASYADDLPLLWQHRHDQPVGRVKFGNPTKDGIPFTATIPRVPMPGALQARVDEAWDSVRSGLVRAVSIGFRALKDGVETLKGGGYRFTKTEIMELSLVTIPANSDAVITAIKAFDQKHLPASGDEGVEGDTPASVEAAPNRPEVVFLNPPKPARKHQIIEVIQ